MDHILGHSIILYWFLEVHYILLWLTYVMCACLHVCMCVCLIRAVVQHLVWEALDKFLSRLSSRVTILSLQCFRLWEDTMCRRGTVSKASVTQPVAVMANISHGWEYLLVSSLPYLFCSPLHVRQPQPSSYWRPRMPQLGFSQYSCLQPPMGSECLRKVLSSHSSDLSHFAYNSRSQWILWKELAGRWTLDWWLGPFRILNHHTRQHLTSVSSIIIVITLF